MEPEKNSNPESEQDLDKKSQCSFCGQKFIFAKALQNHEKRHEGKGGFICKTCGLQFTSTEAKERHRDKEHKILKCRICNIKFDTHTQYLQHINSLHDGRDSELSICSECGKQFKTKGELRHHTISKCGTIKKYYCKICAKSLMSPGSLHNHMLRHTGHRRYMCRFCAKTFLTQGQLTVHERIHTQEKAFICEVCNKGFCHRQSLVTHSTLHTGIKPYQCENCYNSFSCVGNLLKHRKTHADTCGKIPLTTHRVKHPATKIKVQVNTPATIKIKTTKKRKEFLSLQNQEVSQNSEQSCDNNLSDNNEMEVVNEENNKIDFEIQEGEDLPFESDMIVKEENWIPTTIPIIEENDTSSEEKKKVLIVSLSCKNTCEIDKDGVAEKRLDKEKNDEHVEEYWDSDGGNSDVSVSEEKDYLKENIDVEKVDEKNKDNDVSISEDSIDLLTRKEKQKEMKILEERPKRIRRKKSKVDREKLKEFMKDRNDDEEKGFKCKYCRNHYTVPLWLMKHELKHEELMKNGEISRFKCSCCSMIFDDKELCLEHQHTAHADELKCTHCDRHFANPESLKAHIKAFHKGMPKKKYVYICDKCGKVFKQKEILLIHEKNNCTNGPLFKCTFCTKSYTSKHVLKTHTRIHLDEKSLLCKYCGKSFHWKGQLKIHERSHTGEQPFKCQHCPKSFAYRESLITHTTLHTGIKPHLCENCGSRFSCIGNLLKHRKTHANTCGYTNQVKMELMVP